MDSARLVFFLGLWLCVAVPATVSQEPPTPREEPAQEEPPKEVKKDPRVVAIGRAMAEQATRAVPVHFKIRVQDSHPTEDTKVTASGELWAIGDQKLRFVLDIRMGRMPGNRQELVINEKGTWVRFPMGGVVTFDPVLWKKIQFMQARGKASFGGRMAGRQMDILANLEEQGFELSWQGQKKIGDLVVDEILGSRKAPGRSGGTLDDPAGLIDRCLLRIGEKDRIPRRMEWFAGEESVRLMEYSDVEVGKELDPEVFAFVAEESDQVVDALKHPLLAPELQELLRKYEEEIRKDAEQPVPPEKQDD